jgi:PAS domain S-box-containing protein
MIEPGALDVSIGAVQNERHEVTALIVQARETSPEDAQLALERAGVGYWTWDVPRDRLWTNPCVREMMGLPRESRLPDIASWLDIVVPHDRTALESALLRGIETKSPWIAEFRVLLNDGSVRWLSTQAGVRCDSSRAVVEVNGITTDITAGKSAERALVQSERQYLDLVNSLDGIVWEADGQTFAFSFVSSPAERILGYPVENWITDDEFWRKHLHPDDAEWCIDFCIDATRNGRDHEFEYRMIAADGSVVWLHDLVTVQRDESGGTRLRGIMLDITTAKNAEAALKQSEDRFRLMFERSAAGMAVTGPEGRILDLNAAFSTLLGASQQDLKGQRLPDLVDPPHRDAFIQQFQQILNDQQISMDIEVKLARKDGESAWARVTAAFLFSAGIPVYCMAVAFDVSARKRAEEILRESDVRFRIIANDTPAYLWMSTGEDSNSYINKPLARFLGTTQDRLGSDWTTYIHPHDTARAQTKYLDCLSRRSAYRDEFRVRRWDGEYRYMINEALPRFSPANEFLGYAGALLDITDRKRVEEQLRTAHDLLTTELIERRRAEQEILALSQRLISAQEEERSRIARELHDNLSQQIAALTISLGKLKSQIPVDPPDPRQQAERLRQGLVNLADCIRNLSHELHPAVLEHAGLSAALRQFCDEFTAITGLKVHFQATESFADTDTAAALCLYRVTQEALQNVRRHSTAAEARVSVTRASDQICLTISDQGRGFLPARARSSGGLGLVSMKERVRLVNGVFQLNSEPNRGATITVKVPLHPSG